MGEAQVISCHSLEQFSYNLEDANKSSKLVLVDFTASWCPPCRAIAPILADYAKEFPHVLIMKVDVDELKPVAEQFQVEAMPTFVFLKDGNVVDKFVGADKNGLRAAIIKNSGASSA